MSWLSEKLGRGLFGPWIRRTLRRNRHSIANFISSEVLDALIAAKIPDLQAEAAAEKVRRTLEMLLE